MEIEIRGKKHFNNNKIQSQNNQKIMGGKQINS